MPLIIGIDAGGTTTTGMILNSEKDILYEVHSGMGNPTVHFNDAATHIGHVISSCLASSNGSRCEMVVAGIAGIEAGDNKARMEKALSAITSLPIVLVNDALLALYAIFGQGDGVLTIAGTGSISVGARERTVKYTGGWGHLLGDFGSSYHVAIEACKQLADDLDSELILRPLSKQLMEHLQIIDATGLKRFVYHSSKGDIAALSSYIYSLAFDGDMDAQKQFLNAGIELAKQTEKLIQKLGFTTIPLIVCKGSLLEKNTFAFDAFNTYLHNLYPTTEIRISKIYPTIGAVTIAENLLKMTYRKEQDDGYGIR